MKTHLTAFLVTVGFFAAVIFIGFALYTWRWIAIALLFAILFAFVYFIAYTTIQDIKDSKAIDKIKEAEWQQLCDRISRETKKEATDADPEGVTHQ